MKMNKTKEIDLPRLIKLLPKNPRKAYNMLMVYKLMMKMDEIKNRGKQRGLEDE